MRTSRLLRTTLICIFLLVLFVSPANGQDAEPAATPTPELDCQKAWPILAGETAACSGVVMPIAMLQDVKLTLEATEAKLRFCEEECQLKIDALDVELAASKEYLVTCEQEVATLRDVVLASTEPPEVVWYESVPFVVTTTAILSIGLTVGFYALAAHLASRP